MKKKFRFAVFGIVLLYMLGMSGCGVNHKTPEGVVTSLIDSYAEGKVKKIPYLLGSNKNDIFVDKKDADAGIKSRLYQGCVAFSHKLVKMGHAAPYVYYFKRNLPGDDAGAFHSSELWYTFGSLKHCWRPMTKADYALSQRMVEYWTEFARTGNPNKGDDPCWKPCTLEEPFVMEFDVAKE